MQSQLSVSNLVKFQKPPKIHKKAEIIAPPRATQSIQVGARNQLVKLRYYDSSVILAIGRQFNYRSINLQLEIFTQKCTSKALMFKNLPQHQQKFKIKQKYSKVRIFYRCQFHTTEDNELAPQQTTNLEHHLHLGSQRPYPNRRTVIEPNEFLSLKVSFCSFFLFFSNVQIRRKTSQNRQNRIKLIHV